MSVTVREILVVGLVTGLLAYFTSPGLALVFLLVAGVVILARGR